MAGTRRARQPGGPRRGVRGRAERGRRAAASRTTTSRPTKPVYAVIERPPRPRVPREPEPAERQLRVMRWGLVPSWAKDRQDRQPADQRPDGDGGGEAGVPQAFAERRCLLPADGYYEWYPTEQTPRPASRQAAVLHPSAPTAACWRWPGSTRSGATRPRTGTTRDALAAGPARCSPPTAEDAVGRIHDRMPLMVERGALGRLARPDGARPRRPARRCWCRPRRAGSRRIPVSTAVNNVRNNGPDLVEPLPSPHRGDLTVTPQLRRHAATARRGWSPPPAARRRHAASSATAPAAASRHRDLAALAGARCRGRGSPSSASSSRGGSPASAVAARPRTLDKAWLAAVPEAAALPA